jgi:HSP20 family molecular chaperone IbpA
MAQTNVKSSFLLGFDESFGALQRAAGGSDGYPPFDIERIAKSSGEVCRLRITLAVAGFTADRLEVTAERGQLVIHGRHSDRNDEKTRIFLHRGIAARQFQRVFHFAEAMRVASAALERGLLSVELIRLEPEQTGERQN